MDHELNWLNTGSNCKWKLIAAFMNDGYYVNSC